MALTLAEELAEQERVGLEAYSERFWARHSDKLEEFRRYREAEKFAWVKTFENGRYYRQPEAQPSVQAAHSATDQTEEAESNAAVQAYFAHRYGKPSQVQLTVQPPDREIYSAEAEAEEDALIATFFQSRS